ncbi:MAG: recombinase family protein [Pseudolabrys sp.]|nr:recombinase family protein [Pseudolabrys sp.]MDP2298323.1 recombinase family protein [Pseudolabrys sp.]
MASTIGKSRSNNSKSIEPVFRRVAQYVRMSTDHQRYSIESQVAAIAEYALCNEMTVIKTYADEGRSGVTMKGREALKSLIADVQNGRANFEAVLVYDVSRWGRFQDADESAYYEFICKSAGISVIYCAELFENNGSMLATMIKVMKRAMAGEYSRELSAKVARAHRRHAELGFHQGGPANYGLRRVLVDANNKRKMPLQHGEAKSLQGDRVILVKGPNEETDLVREIFRLFTDERMPQRKIARHLNAQGFTNRRGNKWSNTNIVNMLQNEKYAGTFVYCRTSWSLAEGPIRNSADKWIRVENMIEPVIDRKTYNTAQLLLKDGWTYTDNELLDYLTASWCVTGYLSAPRMYKSRFTPTPVTYRERFGSLLNAYRLIGYRTVHLYRYSRCRDLVRYLHRDLICQLTSTSEHHGERIIFDSERQVICLARTLAVAVVVLPFLPRNNTVRPGWKMHFNRLEKCDAVLVARMNKENSALLDYYLFPREIFQKPSHCFTDDTIGRFSQFKLISTSNFYRFAREKFSALEETDTLPEPSC